LFGYQSVTGPILAPAEAIKAVNVTTNKFGAEFGMAVKHGARRSTLNVNPFIRLGPVRHPRRKPAVLPAEALIDAAAFVQLARRDALRRRRLER